jgi:UDP-N-acetylglucosamine transferase subunit ALG13
LGNERKYFVNIAHYKKPWTYLFQLPFFVKVFAKEKPTHILSTGSGRTAFIPFLLAKALRIDFIYIDTFSRVNGYSKMGSFLLRVGNQILSQWEDHKNDKVIYIGPVFKKFENIFKRHNPNNIFVTVGTREEAFTRLIRAVEDLVKKRVIKEKVIVQAGHTPYNSDHLEIFDFCSSEKIDALIIDAKYVITQESAGIGTKCLKYNTKFLVMPRDYKYGELPVKSDMNEDLHFKLEEMGYTQVVNDALELEYAISRIDNLKSGFDFDNELAIATLTRIMERSSQH